MPKKLAPSTERRIAKQSGHYDPRPFIARVEQLLKERNESQHAASVASGLDHQALYRYFTIGRRPHMHACILLADHFDLNPNEFLELAGHPPLKAFEVKAANAQRLPREAIDVALALARLSNPRTRKAVSAAILALLQQFFEE